MTSPTNATEALAREISDMSRHKENDGPELEAALALHGLPHDRPSQLADAFRCGWDRRGDTISAIQEQNVDARGVLDRIDVIAEVADAAPICMGEIRMLIKMHREALEKGEFPTSETTLSALQDQNRALREVIRLVDLYAPRADETCDEPGITFSEAICRQFGVDINILAATKQEGGE